MHDCHMEPSLIPAFNPQTTFQVTFTSNKAIYRGGGAIYCSDADLWVHNSTFKRNKAVSHESCPVCVSVAHPICRLKGSFSNGP